MELLIPGVFIGAIIVIAGGAYWYMGEQRKRKAEQARTDPIMDRVITQSQAGPSNPPSSSDGSPDGAAPGA